MRREGICRGSKGREGKQVKEEGIGEGTYGRRRLKRLESHICCDIVPCPILTNYKLPYSVYNHIIVLLQKLARFGIQKKCFNMLFRIYNLEEGTKVCRNFSFLLGEMYIK